MSLQPEEDYHARGIVDTGAVMFLIVLSSLVALGTVVVALTEPQAFRAARLKLDWSGNEMVCKTRLT